MRVLQINASYKPPHIYGRSKTSVHKLSKSLLEGGCTIDFTTLYFHPAPFIRLWKEIRSFDIVHIHSWYNCLSVLSYLIAFFRRVPVVMSLHGSLSSHFFANKQSILKKLSYILVGKHILKRCHIHAGSDGETTEIKQLLKPKSLFTINDVVDFPSYIPPGPESNKVLKLLFLSGFTQNTGLEMLFSALMDVQVPYQLTIAENENESCHLKLKELVKKYKIDSRTELVNLKTHGKFQTIAAHHVVVFPVYYEHANDEAIESLSVGTAVLMNRELGMSSYVKQHNFGWLCETGVSSIKNNIMTIYKNQGLLNIIREFAPVIIVRQFNEEIITSAHINMYDQVYRSTHS